MSGNEGASPKDCDPGWNDPPYFSYEHTNYEKTSKVKLNKRVVHTFSMPMVRHEGEGEGEGEGECEGEDGYGSDGGHGPERLQKPEEEQCGPPKGSAPPQDKVAPQSPQEESDFAVSLSDTMYNFLAALEDIKQENEKDSTEIKKRLDILEKMWMDGSFPKDVQKKIHIMSSALVLKNEEEVNRLQRVLMVDHSRLCSSWMAGIRKLISAKLNS